MEAIVGGVFDFFLVGLAGAHHDQLVGHALDDVFGADGVLKLGIDVIQRKRYTDLAGIEDAIEQGQNCLDFEIFVGEISAVAEVDARAAGAFVACALLLSVFAGAASLTAAAQLDLDAVAVDFDVGDGNPFVALDADAFILEEFAEVLQVDAALVESFVGLGVEVEVETLFVGGQVEEGLHIFAEEKLAEGDFCLLAGGGAAWQSIERHESKEQSRGQQCGAAILE